MKNPKSRTRPHLTFKQKLILVCIVPLLSIGMVIGVLSYKKAENTAKENNKSAVNDVVNRMDMSITVRSRQLDAAGGVICGSLEAARIPGYTEQELEALVENHLSPFQEVTSASVFYGETCVYTTHENAGSLRQEVLAALYEEAARFPAKCLWSDMDQGLFEGEDALLLYRGMQNAAGQTKGLLVMEVAPQTLGTMIFAKQKTVARQTSLMLDTSFQIIYRDNTVPETLLTAATDAYKSGKRKFSVRVGESTYYVYSQYNGMTGWVTLAMVEEAYLFEDGKALREYIIMLVAASVIAASLILYILLHGLTKPLAQLNQGMKEAHRKNLNIMLPNKRRDEIGELTDSFNFMMQRIRELIARITEEKLAQKNAEIEALQAQINPHFLYNTLDSINWMLIEKDEPDISAIVVALGKLMQYSMDTGTSMVTLREEYDNAKDYLTIWKNRLEENLSYRLELDEAIEEFRVPKLILQPLIENSIRHGIVPAGNQGSLLVKSVREEDCIRVTVKDDGAGMTKEELAAFLRRLKQVRSKAGGSIGICNVSRRLQLHFDGHCRFEVKSAPQAGTEISLLLPLDFKGSGV